MTALEEKHYSLSVLQIWEWLLREAEQCVQGHAVRKGVERRDLDRLTPKPECSITTPKSRRMDLGQKKYLSKVGSPTPGRVQGLGAGERGLQSCDGAGPFRLCSFSPCHPVPLHPLRLSGRGRQAPLGEEGGARGWRGKSSLSPPPAPSAAPQSGSPSLRSGRGHAGPFLQLCLFSAHRTFFP